MKLKINKKAFASLLQKVQSITQQEKTMPILSHVLLRASGEKLEVQATDLALFYKGQCEAEVLKQGEIVIPSKTLYEIIRNINTEEIFLNENENSWLEIKSNTSYFTLASLPVEDFPLIPEQGDLNLISFPSKELHKNIFKAQFAMAKEKYNSSLAGLCCEKIDDNTLRFVATDGYRLSYVDFQCPDAAKLQFRGKVMLSRKSVMEVLKFCSQTENLRFGFNPTWGVFKTEIDALYIKLMEDKFPEYQGVIPETSNFQVKIPKSKLKDILKRVVILCNKEDVKVGDFSFEGEGNLLTVKVENESIGKAEEKLEVNFIGESFTGHLKFNISYVLDVLNVLESDVCYLEINFNRVPCVITGDEKDKGFKALIAAMVER